MIVSVALFAIVITMVSAAYLNLIALDRNSRATSDTTNNISFAIDGMSRAIRTGTNYKCGGSGTNCWPPASPSSTLTFTNDQNIVVTYSLDTVNHQIDECYDTTTCSAIPFTDPNVVVNTLSFYVRGVGVGDGVQPEVVIVANASVSVGQGRAPVNFNIQTLASERGVEL
jgi:type II secretory pathway pseudopilin PulG